MADGELTNRSARMQLRKELRRGELVEAAFRLFAVRGFAATRLEDVAAAAGVAKGTVVIYFPSKDTLFTAVVRECLAPQLARAEVIAGEPGSPRERLLRLAGFLWESLTDPHLGAIPRLIVAESSHFPDLARQFHIEVCERSRAVQADLIAQGIAAGEFRPIDPAIHARLLIDPLIMFAINRHSIGCHDPCPVDPQVYFSTHIDTFMRGIAAHPGTEPPCAPAPSSRP